MASWLVELLVATALFAAIGGGVLFLGRWFGAEHSPVGGYARARFAFSALIIAAVSLLFLGFLNPLLAVAIICVLAAVLVMAFTSERPRG